MNPVAFASIERPAAPDFSTAPNLLRIKTNAVAATAIATAEATPAATPMTTFFFFLAFEALSALLTMNFSDGLKLFDCVNSVEKLKSFISIDESVEYIPVLENLSDL